MKQDYRDMIFDAGATGCGYRAFRYRKNIAGIGNKFYVKTFLARQRPHVFPCLVECLSVTHDSDFTIKREQLQLIFTAFSISAGERFHKKISLTIINTQRLEGIAFLFRLDPFAYEAAIDVFG